LEECAVLDLTRRFGDILRMGGADPAVQYQGEWHSWEWLASVGDEIERLIPLADPGLSIGLVTRNRPGTVAAYVSAWARHRPVLTFNPMSADEKLVEELQTSRPAVVLASREDWDRPHFTDAVRAIGGAGLELGLGDDPVKRVPGLEQVGGGPHHHCEEGVAVVLQTSGTTGPPKRIPLKLDDLGSAVSGAQRLVNARDEDRPRLHSGVTVLAMPLGHMGAVFSICLNVAEGRRLVLMDRFEPTEWARLVREHDVKVLNLVPAMMRMVLDAGVPREMLAGAKIARSGTAALPVALAEKFERTYGLPVLQNYGSTEFAGGVAGWNLAQWHEWGESKRGSVGTAVPGVELRVVDPESGAVLQPGTTGLLEVLSPHSVGVPPGTWVRTNDLAELDRDGFLWIRGRIDDVIIRGGFKVDANEVRAALEKHPQVKEAVVVSLPDDRLGQVPAAAVVPIPGGEDPDPAELCSYLRGQLEPYKVPTQIVKVDELPRNSAMKVQLQAVRALFGDGTDQDIVVGTTPRAT
jgi:long-chain acyl-CoA synthetase